jgi:hypothetical protein
MRDIQTWLHWVAFFNGFARVWYARRIRYKSLLKPLVSVQ